MHLDSAFLNHEYTSDLRASHGMFAAVVDDYRNRHGPCHEAEQHERFAQPIGDRAVLSADLRRCGHDQGARAGQGRSGARHQTRNSPCASPAVIS